MPTRKLFHDSVIEMPVQPGPVASGLNVHAATAEHHDDSMSISFSLSPSNNLNEELEKRVENGERLPIQELRDRYGVSKEQIAPLLKWLKENGFTVDYQAPDNTSIQTTAAASDVAKALHVELVRVTKDGITYTSARNAPSLPDDVAGNVRAIIGLQPHRQAHKHSRRLPPGLGRTAKRRAGTAKAAASVPGYLPADILRAYGADGIDTTGDDQIIAIVIDTVPKEADMVAFWKQSGIPVDASRVQVVNVTAAVLPPPSGEETLDAQWASGIATGARLRIYATGTLRFSDIDHALDRILHDIAHEPGLRQVSMSLGLGEAYMAPGEVKTEHAKFLRLAAAGVNVFVSSGDAGSNPDSTGHGGGGPLQVEYESSDPCVIGVGGTTLKIASDGTVQESSWAGAGGGRSMYFKRPAWQKVNGKASGGNRMVPDVSLTADPNYGGFVVLNGDAVEYGGTSWSAPVWAAFCALVNAARVKQGKDPLSFLNPVLYKAKGTACLRDIAGGNNGAYEAVKGYDMVTGLGVPNVQQLINTLP